MRKLKISLILIFCFVSIASYAFNLKPLKGYKIMIDPGHGGGDPGAVGASGLKESDVNLRVARYLAMLLKADGAEPVMTRTGDYYVSLRERVSMAKKENPDLFISIHHNSSLSQVTEDKSEIYYDGRDFGISRILGEELLYSMSMYNESGRADLIPGGFYILRNNPVPAVLVEGNYISCPETEKTLRTGKVLTNQANAIRMAVRDTLAPGIIDLDFLLENKERIDVTVPFINLLFTANTLVENASAFLLPETTINFKLSEIPASYSNVYNLFNTEALSSGNYKLVITAANSQTFSRRYVFDLNVKLPVKDIDFHPIAPCIPEDFQGYFPVRVTLKDYAGNINKTQAEVTVSYNGNREILTIDSSGKNTFFLHLTGKERENVEINFEFGEGLTKTVTVPIENVKTTFILGKVTDTRGLPIDNACVSCSSGEVYTDSDGLFFCSLPHNLKNVSFNISSNNGYASKTMTFSTETVPLLLPSIQLKETGLTLKDTKIAVIADQTTLVTAENLIKSLNEAGSSAFLVDTSSLAQPAYQALLEVNNHEDLDLLISLKMTDEVGVRIGHYHSSAVGKQIASRIKKELAKKHIKASAGAASSYELSHTGAAALTVTFSSRFDTQTNKIIKDAICSALQYNKQEP